MTLTEAVHEALADSETPDNEIDVAPAEAETTPPGQVVEAPGVGATAMPFGAPPEVPSAVK